MLEDGSAIVNPAEDTTDQGAFNANLANLIPEDEGKTFGRGEFSYDDPNLIKFIQKRADSNETTFKEELMKFVDEVESFYRNKKANGGIVSINSLTQGL